MEQRLERIAVALERIADALEGCAAEVATGRPVCAHPISARVDLAGMGNLDEWVCSPRKGGCGYEYHGGAQFDAPV